MNTILIILTIIAILFGLIGCVLPVIPGIPIAFIAILLYAWYDGFAHIGAGYLIFLAVLTVFTIISDFVLIALSSRLAGSSKYSALGATIGALLGFFIFPPFGILIFCLLGAFVTELYFINDTKKALKAAFGSAVGLFSGIVLKLIIGLYMLISFVTHVVFKSA